MPDPSDNLVLTRSAQEGVDLLQGIVDRGDPEVYQEVQALLLSDTPKHSPEDGPEVDHPDQAPGRWPADVSLEPEVPW